MSRENVELFERALAALNRRDLEAFLALMDDGVEAVPRIAAMEGGYHAPEGIAAGGTAYSASSPTSRSTFWRCAIWAT